MSTPKKRTKPVKYDAAGVLWIKENLSLKTRKEMADHFGSTYKAFNKFLSVLRKEGMDIPFEKKGPGAAVPIGTIRERKDRQRTRLVEKTSSGWIDITNKGKERKKPGRKPKEKKKVVKVAKVKDAKLFTRIEKEKKPKIDGRADRPGPAKRKHMDHKPPVEGAHFKKPEKVFKTRKVKDGPIVIILKDKAKTRLTARDEEHAARIREKYAYLEKDVVARF